MTRTSPELAAPCPPQRPLSAHGAVVAAYPRSLGLPHTQASHAVGHRNRRGWRRYLKRGNVVHNSPQWLVHTTINARVSSEIGAQALDSHSARNMPEAFSGGMPFRNAGGSTLTRIITGTEDKTTRVKTEVVRGLSLLLSRWPNVGSACRVLRFRAIRPEVERVFIARSYVVHVGFVGSVGAMTLGKSQEKRSWYARTHPQAL